MILPASKFVNKKTGNAHTMDTQVAPMVHSPAKTLSSKTPSSLHKQSRDDDQDHELYMPVGLQRVVSFSGFNSVPLYEIERKTDVGPSNNQESNHGDNGSALNSTLPNDIKGNHKRMFWKKLLKERRKQISDTVEFKQLCFNMASDSIDLLINKMVKAKQQ